VEYFSVGCKTNNCYKFGIIIIDNDMSVMEIKEKKHLSKGIINCGVYIIRKEVFTEERREKPFF